MDLPQFTADLFRFLQASPTSFHAIDTMRQGCRAMGMTELSENETWGKLTAGKSYYLVRDHGALIAFCLGATAQHGDGFRLLATHCDSPALQIKPRAEVVNASPYLQLAVEVYGGPLLNTWFDRDLSLAGRVCFLDYQGVLKEVLVDFSRPFLIIPSLAIHFDREANSQKSVDAQKHLPPVLAQLHHDKPASFNEIVMGQLKRQYPDEQAREIISFDLFCYDPQPPAILGYGEEFISGGRLDNLLSCHAALTAMGEAGNCQNTMLLCANHEENGSTSAVGAHGSFALDVLARLLPEEEDRQITLRNSFLLSLDNAHAIHPNFKDKADPGHMVQLNGGPVLKLNANQRYATSARSAAVVKVLAREANVPIQEFVMRSDLPCGSTIGPITAAKLGITTADIGAPTLAMHSIREMTGSRDPYLLYQLVRHFLGTPLNHLLDR